MISDPELFLNAIDDKFAQLEVKLWSLINDESDIYARIEEFRRNQPGVLQDCDGEESLTIRPITRRCYGKPISSAEIIKRIGAENIAAKCSDLQNRLQKYEMHLWSLLDEKLELQSIIEEIRQETYRNQIKVEDEEEKPTSSIDCVLPLIEIDQEKPEEPITEKVSRKIYVYDINGGFNSKRTVKRRKPLQETTTADVLGTCSTCGWTCSTLAELKFHRKIHQEGKFSCDICSRKFNDLSSVKEHMILHIARGIKPPPCEICGKKLATKYSLKQHMTTHNSRKYNCEVCDKDFTNPYRLTRHMQCHTGQLVCTVCDKGLSQSTELKVHMRLHTGEKPFACSVCDRRFTDRRNMKKHEKIHEKYRKKK